MKRFALLAICISLFTGCATTSMVTRETKLEITAKPDLATLVIIRDSLFGKPFVFRHYLDEKLIGETQGRTYFVTYVKPGPHYVLVAAENTVVYRLDFQPGKIYYLCDLVAMGVWRAGTLGFQPYTQQDAMEAIKDCQYLELDPNKTHEDMDPKLYNGAVEGYHAEVKRNPEGFKAVLEYKGY